MYFQGACDGAWFANGCRPPRISCGPAAEPTSNVDSRLARTGAARSAANRRLDIRSGRMFAVARRRDVAAMAWQNGENRTKHIAIGGTATQGRNRVGGP